MKALHKKRLLNVAKALRDAAKVPLLREAFTMELVFYQSYSRFECGTPACALGHYAARRDLQKQFSIDKENGYLNFKGRHWSKTSAVNHFGISEEEDEKIFGSWGCNNDETPIEAAKYIEKFVKNQGTKK